MVLLDIYENAMSDFRTVLSLRHQISEKLKEQGFMKNEQVRLLNVPVKSKNLLFLAVRPEDAG